jgi:hypothetical protein
MYWLRVPPNASVRRGADTRHLRAPSGDANHGQAARRVRLFRARGQSVLSRGKTNGHRREADQGDDGVPQRDERGDGHDGCEGICRLAASFHGGGLVNDASGPNSPHLLAAATKASFLIAIAENDDKQRPNDKTVLKETFDKARLSAEIEVYQAAHGWCPPDTQVYNEPAAERAWSRLLALYGKALA